MDSLPLSPTSTAPAGPVRPVKPEDAAPEDAFLALLAAMLGPGQAPPQPVAGEAPPPADAPAAGPAPSTMAATAPATIGPAAAPPTCDAPAKGSARGENQPATSAGGSEAEASLGSTLPAEWPVATTAGEPARIATKPVALRRPEAEVGSGHGHAADFRTPGRALMAREPEPATPEPAPGLLGAAAPAAGTPLPSADVSMDVPPAASVSAPASSSVAGRIAPEPPSAPASASTSTPAPAPAVPLVPPHPLSQGGTARLVRHGAGDGQRLTIELDPAELGPVEVALRLDDRGAATALFTVDRPETLQLLQRDARTLADMLGQAGFTLDPGGLGFSLRDHGQGRERAPPQPAAGEPAGRQAAAREGGGKSHVVAAASGLLDLRV
jgi:flagellar hook-length control protein FliK